MNTLRVDPTRTTMLRRKFERELAHRLNELKRRFIAYLSIGMVENFDTASLHEAAYSNEPHEYHKRIGLTENAGFDPNQARDKDGRWVDYHIDKAEYDNKVQLIFKLGGKEVGEITLQPRPDSNYEIGNVLVWPEFQRKGHATNFYRAAAAEAKARGKQLFISDDRTDDAKSLHETFKAKGHLGPSGELTFNLVANARRLAPAQTAALGGWLARQANILLASQSTAGDDAWWARHVREGYLRGSARAYDDARRSALRRPAAHVSGRAELLSQLSVQPSPRQNLSLLQSRVGNELQGMGDTLRQQLVREVIDSAARGEREAQTVARVSKIVDGIKTVAARRIVRTEIVRAHAEGQLDALEQMGVFTVRVMVEWVTAKDGKVCPKCRALQGIVLTTREARGLIPRHPNCRCCFAPAIREEDDQKRHRWKINRAINKSLKAEIPKRNKRRSVKTQRRLSRWAGARLKVGKRKRMKSK